MGYLKWYVGCYEARLGQLKLRLEKGILIIIGRRLRFYGPCSFAGSGESFEIQ